LIGRDRIFGVDKGVFHSERGDMHADIKKKGRDPKVSASRFDCLKNKKVQLGLWKNTDHRSEFFRGKSLNGFFTKRLG
jgi:hypothetical protein